MTTRPYLVPSSTATPLERLADDYLASVAARGLSPSTEIAYRHSLGRVFLPWCREQTITRVEELDRRVLDRFSRDLLQRPSARGGTLSKHSVHTYTRAVRQMLAWAAVEGEEVSAKPQLPKLPRLRKSVLGREEIDRLEATAVTDRDRLIIRIFADCGLRLSELVGLRRSSIVRNGGATYLDVLGKGRRQRRVPISPSLARRLERHLTARTGSDDGQLFMAARADSWGQVSALGPDGVKRMIDIAGRRAGFTQRVHPHLLRHSWMTEMLRRGMNPIQLSVIAGASQEVIAEHYEHLTEEDAYHATMRALSAGSSR
jgi:integrase/recombinase XerD